ncbi:MAG: hypothetical protein M1834_002875 [Cirrosporium novae-zelandiae]|nr:MAG: hypothetical protein M1834_002875 [Cirrosporium novae-zelandiae]
MPSFFKITALAALAAPVAYTMPLFSRATAQSSEYLCGISDSVILSDTPWIVYNMLYNSASMTSSDSQCTYYDTWATSSSGTQTVTWGSATNIEYVESTNNVPKGYSFVGLTTNLESTINAIDSIPSTYDWTRTNTTAFKGNICFDFMTSDTKGDSTSTSAHELMLWLQYEGGQLPIGYTDGPVTTIQNLFGTSWDLYEGTNEDSGITVHSMLPTTQFDGKFEGDLKEWLLKFVNLGRFTKSTFVNVGNAGTEFFYGDAVMNATLALQIDLA